MDTRDTRVHNLLFLLSAAPLGVGCVITGGDDTDTAAETTPNPTDDTTAGAETPATDTGPGVTDDGVTDDTTTMTPADETTVTAGDETITAGDETATTGGVEVPPACASYGDAIALCYDDKAGAAAAQYCAEEIAAFEMYYGAECVTAYEEWLACLSALTCKELMMETVCEPETMMLEMTCAKKGGK